MNEGLIRNHFPDLTDVQYRQYDQLGDLYGEWNRQINVISRKDIENLYERHILHSLGIAKVIRFVPGTQVMDAGTGGGFPGVPLAIMFPDTTFHLVDSTAKKLSVIAAVAGETGLKNITISHSRLEDHQGQYDFVVSRAVASLDQMIRWIWKNIRRGSQNEIPNGLLYLKGEEDGGTEVGTDRKTGPSTNQAICINRYHLDQYFREPYFSTKILVHLFSGEI